MSWSRCFLLLLLSGSCRATAVCDETNYTEHYFGLCRGDDVCQRNFDLHQDEFEFFRYLHNNTLLKPRNLTWENICSSETVEVLWLALLRTHPLCEPNYFPDRDLGCVLRGDRADANQFAAGHRATVGIFVLMLAVAALIFYMLFRQFKMTEKLWQSLRTRSPDEAAAALAIASEVEFSPSIDLPDTLPTRRDAYQ